MKSKVVIRPSVPDDFKQLDKVLPFRVKALTGLVDDRVIGVGGIGTMPDGTRIAFTWLSDEARSYPVALHKIARKVLEQARQDGIRTIVALADQDTPAAERWLERLGFEMTIIEHEKVWLWHSSRS